MRGEHAPVGPERNRLPMKRNPDSCAGVTETSFETVRFQADGWSGRLRLFSLPKPS